MKNQERRFTNRAPMFIGKNYVFWKVTMKTYIESLGANVWDVVGEEYQNPLVVITKYQNMEFSCNAKAINAFLASLPE